MSDTTSDSTGGTRSSDTPAFPITATIAGVAVVTIPATDYAELLSLPSKFGAASGQYAPGPRSPIDADPEVSAFLRERFGSRRVLDILADCTKQFGVDRTPSRTAAYAYWKRLRKYSRKAA